MVFGDRDRGRAGRPCRGRAGAGDAGDASPRVRLEQGLGAPVTASSDARVLGLLESGGFTSEILP